MRKGNAGERGGAQRGGDSGNGFAGNAGAVERFGFFAAATKNRWIAPLEPNNALPGTGRVDHRFQDRLTIQGMASIEFGHADRACARPHMQQECGRNEFIVNDEIGLAEQFDGSKRQ